jgi:uncharacterized membrane protein
MNRPTTDESANPPVRRIDSIDAVRGLIMIIMALDHIRDFIHRGAMTASPTNLVTTTPLLFMTRWITHICAPVFMFTAGLGAFFWWQRGRRGPRTKRELSIFLLTRGLWLVVLELTVMRLAYNFDFSSSYPVLLLILWILGLCMIGLAVLVWLPVRWLGVLSVLVIVLHNTLDGIDPRRFGAAAPIWNLIHQPGAFTIGGVVMLAPYPLIPWVMVMALGFSFGAFYTMSATRRQRYFIGIGTAATIAFVVIRGINVYGDPARWSAQHSAIFTMLSFLNTTKYPPSLDFLLMTLGPAIVLLALAERIRFSSSNPLIVFGRVPLFYFVLHFYAAHVVTVLLAFARYGSAAWNFVFQQVPSMGGPARLYPTPFGYDLWVAYVVWAGIVIALYPLCRRYANVKARRRDWWLSYL